MTRKPTKKAKRGTAGKGQRRSERAKKDALVEKLLSIDELKGVGGGFTCSQYCTP